MNAHCENATDACTNIKRRIRQYIADHLLFSANGFEYRDDDSFLEKGIVDSVGVLELVLFVEQTFGATIEGRDMTPDNFDSVENLARYIQRRLSNESCPAFPDLSVQQRQA